jgi:hypothetical protein
LNRAEGVPARGFTGSFAWPMQVDVAMDVLGLTLGPATVALSRQGTRH